MNRADWERELLDAIDAHAQAMALSDAATRRIKLLQEQQTAHDNDAGAAWTRAKTALDALQKLATERHTKAPLGLEE